MNLMNNNNAAAKLFLDEGGPVGIARFDVAKYPKIQKLFLKQHSFFWTPEEIDLTKDKRDFMDFTEAEEHIFTSNIKRQIVLDSQQGRAPSLAFLPIVSNSEAEQFITLWTAFEGLHSRSYTHIIRNLYNNPSVVFDEMSDIEEISDCARSISEQYDELIEMNCEYVKTGKVRFEHKVALWKTLVAVNGLEGIRFYLSFANTWNFGQRKKIIGTSSSMKLICRDENIHLAFTTFLLNTLPMDDPDYAIISERYKGDCTKIFLDIIEQEKSWNRYLFKKGSTVGLNERLGNEYLDWLGVRRMSAIGLASPMKGIATNNPLPWTANYISSDKLQTANQETENVSYVVGGIEPDLGSLSSKSLSFDKLFSEVE